MSCPDPVVGVQSISPRVRNAVRLVLLGGARTKKEAAEAMGLHPVYLRALMDRNEVVKTFAKQIEDDLSNKAMDASIVLQKIGRQAVTKIVQLMESGSENVALKAAIDLADRSPEVQKIQRLEVSSLTLDGRDAAQLAQALVESAKHRERYIAVATEGLIELTAQEASDARAAAAGDSTVGTVSHTERLAAET